MAAAFKILWIQRTYDGTLEQNDLSIELSKRALDMLMKFKPKSRKVHGVKSQLLAPKTCIAAANCNLVQSMGIG